MKKRKKKKVIEVKKKRKYTRKKKNITKNLNGKIKTKLINERSSAGLIIEFYFQRHFFSFYFFIVSVLFFLYFS